MPLSVGTRPAGHARMRTETSRATGWAAAVFLAALTAPLQARAQTCPHVALSADGIVNRYYSGPDIAANAAPLRPANEQPRWIDEQDCEENIHLQFDVTASGLPCADLVQVWVGPTDCTQLIARQSSSGSSRCWPVSDAVPISESFTVDIRAQDIVAWLSSESPPTEYSFQGASACSVLASCGSGGPLQLYFMAVEASGQTVDGTSAEYGFGAFHGHECGEDSGTPDASEPSSEDADSSSDAYARSDFPVDAGSASADSGEALLEKGCTCTEAPAPPAGETLFATTALFIIGGLRRRRRPEASLRDQREQRLSSLRSE
jgi:MYXO-CTERM domain-containing protein